VAAVAGAHAAGLAAVLVDEHRTALDVIVELVNRA
jgi:hypothetical protein